MALIGLLKMFYAQVDANVFTDHLYPNTTVGSEGIRK